MSQQGPVIFNGRYELHRRLGRGGMAEVYLARDQMLDRPVAVKVLFPALATDPGFVERFRREAQRAAGLNHPNIVSVYDWGEANGTYFIVMEYVEGQSLAEILQVEGRLHPDRAAEIGADIGSALGFAHRNGGVIHRDVKPGNVMITRDGAVKVADFGIARAMSDSSDQNLTKTGSVMGTATYFSPEQARGQSVDPRSDIYSLGCVMYEMVTGRPPFAGENAVAIAYKHVQEAALPPRQIDPALPDTLEAIILKCLAKNPANRYPSAQDMRADLQRYLQGARIMAEPVLAPPVDPGTTGLMAPTGYMDRTTAMSPYGDSYGDDVYGDYDEEEEEPKRSRSFLVVLLLLILILAGLLFLVARSLGGGNGETTMVTVPNVVGMQQDEAEQTIRDEGLEPKATLETSDQPEGQVLRQVPEATTEAEEGSEVEIFVSGGLEVFPVPEVVGLPVEEAEQILQNDEGEFLVRLQEEANNDVPENQVISQDPGANTEHPKGTTITLTISTGQSEALVPNVVGATQAEAESAIRGQGLNPVVTTEASDSVEEGRVISQDPGPDTPVTPGANVTIVVSSGQGEAEVPNVVGRSEQAARGQLEAAGFEVSITEDSTNNPAEDGRVVSQVPQGGRAPLGSTVSLVIGRFDPLPTTPTTEGGDG
jgi:beta-lactam-binding protein with PASTA domain